MKNYSFYEKFILFVDQYFATELLRTLVNQDPHKASTSTSHVEHEDAEFYNEEFLESNDEEVLGSEDAGELNSETQESEGILKI